MSEIISCPSCHRKLQVPESLLGQDVQCPTCGATFVGTAIGHSAGAPTADVQPEARYPAPRAPQPQPADNRVRYADEDDYGDDRPRRRPRRDLAPHRGSTVLVLGILSLVVCGPLGIPAWVMGQYDLNEMRAGRMDPEGEGTTNAGRICGIIGTSLFGLGIVFMIFWFILFAAAASRF